MPDNAIHMMPECPKGPITNTSASRSRARRYNVEENDRTKEINEIEKINRILNLMNHEQLRLLYIVALSML